MTQKAFNTTRTSLALAAALLLSQGAFASGYNFGTQSAAAQGTANANGAEANDASVIYANPAGMSRLKGLQTSAVLDMVLPTVEFTSSGTPTAIASGNPFPSSSGFVGSNGGDPVHTTFVPHGYVSYQIDNQWSAGIGVFVPYGAKIEFSDDFVGRYYGQKTELKTIDINPAISYKLDSMNSFGFGFDMQYMKAKLQRKVSTSRNPATDATFNVEGDSWGYGFNLGYLLELNERTRFGVAYRSSISHDNEGHAQAAAYTGAIIRQTDSAKAKLETPESLSLNGYHDVNDKLALMGDVTWTRHSRLAQVVIDAQPVTTTYLQMNWEDTMRYSVGAAYKLNQDIKLRAGYAYDESPTQGDADVLPTFPDNDRQWLSVGANWKLSSNDSIDFAYSYIFIRDRSIDRTYDSQTNVDSPLGSALPNYPTYPTGTGTTYGRVQGTFRSHAQIFGVQWNHAF